MPISRARNWVSPPEHLQQGKAEQAIRECKAVLAADPRSAPAHMLLGMAYLAKGSPAMIADAKAELQQASISIRSLVWARFYLARLYLDQGIERKGPAINWRPA